MVFKEFNFVFSKVRKTFFLFLKKSFEAEKNIQKIIFFQKQNNKNTNSFFYQRGVKASSMCSIFCFISLKKVTEIISKRTSNSISFIST